MYNTLHNKGVMDNTTAELWSAAADAFRNVPAWTYDIDNSADDKFCNLALIADDRALIEASARAVAMYSRVDTRSDPDQLLKIETLTRDAGKYALLNSEDVRVCRVLLCVTRALDSADAESHDMLQATLAGQDATPDSYIRHATDAIMLFETLAPQIRTSNRALCNRITNADTILTDKYALKYSKCKARGGC